MGCLPSQGPWLAPAVGSVPPAAADGDDDEEEDLRASFVAHVSAGKGLTQETELIPAENYMALIGQEWRPPVSSKAILTMMMMKMEMSNLGSPCRLCADMAEPLTDTFCFTLANDPTQQGLSLSSLFRLGN